MRCITSFTLTPSWVCADTAEAPGRIVHPADVAHPPAAHMPFGAVQPRRPVEQIRPRLDIPDLLPELQLLVGEGGPPRPLRRGMALWLGV